MTPDEAEDTLAPLAQIGKGQAFSLDGWWVLVERADQAGAFAALETDPQSWMKAQWGSVPRLDKDHRKLAVNGLAADGLSTREIANVLGVSHMTAARDLQPDTPAVTNVTEPVDDGAEYLQPDTPAVTNVTEPVDDGALIPEPRAIDDGDEWYTPKWLFDALAVTFTIDVCAPLDQTFSSVPAGRAFTIVDDGLSQPWDGTVWCNPPYSKPEPWARRMIHHGDGLLLVHMPMNAGWCVDVWDACDGIRLFQAMEFVRPNGEKQRPGYWLQLASFGERSTAALAGLQPFGDAAANKRRIASPMWRR